MRPALLSRFGVVGMMLALSAHSVYAQDSFCRPIDFPGATNTGANGINNAGDIVGEYFGAQYGSFKFTAATGQYSTVSILPDTYTSGRARDAERADSDKRSTLFGEKPIAGARLSLEVWPLYSGALAI